MELENYSDYSWEAFQAARRCAFSSIRASGDLYRMRQAPKAMEPHETLAEEPAEPGRASSITAPLGRPSTRRP